MSEDDYLKIATRVLFTEARLLDQKKFRDWVKLYADDAIFWVPAWKDEYETTSNPNRELSMIYHENSYGLSDRIDRIQSRKSITAMPLPRTVHSYTNIMVDAASTDSIEGNACFTVHTYDPRACKSHTNFGRLEFRLRRLGEAWLIGYKKISLTNDQMATALDFYSV